MSRSYLDVTREGVGSRECTQLIPLACEDVYIPPGGAGSVLPLEVESVKI